jgi:hypothetical protein
MEVYFASKEENNERRQEEFLKLSKGERLMECLRMISQPNPFNISKSDEHPNDKKGNWVLRK